MRVLIRSQRTASFRNTEVGDLARSAEVNEHVVSFDVLK